jgi:hypothetical protein
MEMAPGGQRKSGRRRKLQGPGWLRANFGMVDPLPSDFDVDGGAIKVHLIRWEAGDPPAPGLPDQQRSNVWFLHPWLQPTLGQKR